MRTYILDIIPKIRRFSRKLDDLTFLTNQHWVVIDDVDNVKQVYIFRQNNELLISKNGKVDKAKWEYLGDNALLIDLKEESYLFKHDLFDEILALKIDGKEEYALLVNETKYGHELNSSKSVIEFLNKKYIDNTIKDRIQRTIDIYQLPEYTTKKIPGAKSFFSIKDDEIIIEYDDGIKGKVFMKNNSEEVYFIGKVGGRVMKAKVLYNNIDNCIAALHYSLKTGKIYRDGLIGIFS